MPKNRKTSKSAIKPIIYIAAAVISISVLALILNLEKNTCANSISCIKDLSGNYEPEVEGEFLGKQVYSPADYITAVPSPSVLGQESKSNKRIYIDLTNQMIYAKENENIVYSFQISSGKWGRTPIGDFRIWIKLRYTRMQGGSKALHTYYNLPNVPFTMYFYNDQIPKARGYGIHGAYWHNNFGHPMSHGCINMRIEDSEKLYYWAEPTSATNSTYASLENPGTPITIYGVAPLE